MSGTPVTLRGSAGKASSSADLVSASFTPAADSVLVVWSISNAESGPAPAITGITGHGTWQRINQWYWNSNANVVELWACSVGGSPSAGTITVASGTRTYQEVEFLELACVNLTGGLSGAFGASGYADIANVNTAATRTVTLTGSPLRHDSTTLYMSGGNIADATTNGYFSGSANYADGVYIDNAEHATSGWGMTCGWRYRGQNFVKARNAAATYAYVLVGVEVLYTPAPVRTRYVNPGSTGGDGTTSALSGSNAAYASLQACLNAERTNLVTANVSLDIICATSGAADTTRVNQDVAGWTTDCAHFVRIRADASHRASTKWDTSKYRMTVAWSAGGEAFLGMGATGGPLHCRIEGLQIERTIDSIDAPSRSGNVVTLSPTVANAGDGDVRLIGCHCRFSGTRSFTFTGAGWRVIYGAPANASAVVGPDIYLINNVVTWAGTVTSLSTTSNNAINFEHRQHRLHAWNNTVMVNSEWDLGIAGSASNRYHYCKNNLISGVAAGAFGANYSNTYCDYNATSHATLGYTAGSHDRVSQTFTFAAGDDCALTASDAGAKDYGLTNPDGNDHGVSVGMFSIDVNAASRSGSWDIGADEVTASFNPAWARRANTIIQQRL